MKTGTQIIYALIFFLSVLPKVCAAQDNSKTTEKMIKFLELIDEQYVDTLDIPKLVIDAINAITKSMDPHTKYLTAAEIQRSNESLIGQFGGVGIHYQILYDTLLILSTTDDGPAAKAGLKPGDKIILIDQDTAYGKNISKSFFSEKLRGKIGSKVLITIIRKKEKSIRSFEVVRGNIPIYTIDAAFMLDSKTGYIKINGFSFTTMNEFNKSVKSLKKNGMKNLILDLRGNPGGLMIASIQLADEFLKHGELIVYTEGAHYKREEYKSSSRGELEKEKLIVLVDELSASASEIFAGAMQDLDRAVLIGRRTYGKGLVGRNFILPDGSAIRITTGHYYTPSGRCIQKSYKNGVDAYKNELNNRFKNGEYLHVDSIKFIDSLKYSTKNGRTIYGGGGIMPDIFIPIDTTPISNYHQKLNKFGVINAFAGAYFDKHYDEILNQYPDIRSFKNNFDLIDKQFSEIENFAQQFYKIDPDGSLNTTSKEQILKQFKAYLGRNIYENGAYFELSWEDDIIIQKALEVINSRKEFLIIKN